VKQNSLARAQVMAGDPEDKLQELVKPLVEYFCIQRDVMLVYLFGSQAVDWFRPGSDLDLAVLLDEQGRTPYQLVGTPPGDSSTCGRNRPNGGGYSIAKLGSVDILKTIVN
jgi:hypothetical protein